MSMPRTRQKIMPERELGEGQTRKFKFSWKGKPTECFVARHQGRLVAYVNLCRHIPLTLDYGDNQFFTQDGKSFICETHGAIYDPHSGLCTRGPCAGESLHPVSLEVRDGIIWAVDAPQSNVPPAPQE